MLTTLGRPRWKTDLADTSAAVVLSEGNSLGFLFLATAFLIGCGFGTISSSPVAAPGLQLAGKVHGGQQPVSGATIQLYAAGVNGYGTGAAPLLSTPVTTDSAGSFNITENYVCPSSSSLVYIVATGGNPGVGTGSNSAIALAAALGTCSFGGTTPTLDPTQFININEVTTVAAVYSLAQFWGANTLSVGTSATNVTGLTNAFAIAATLANSANGTAYAATPSGGMTVPQAEIYTLANIVASCVNTAGPSAVAGDPCTTLFSSVQAQNATAPTNTIATLLDIALSPSANVAALYVLVGAKAPFQPGLTSVPADFSVALSGTLSNVDAIYGIAIDSSGNAWTGGGTGVPNNNMTGSLLEFFPEGALVSGAAGFTGGGVAAPLQIAIDPMDNVWAVDGNLDNVTEFNNSGAALTATPIALNSPAPLISDLKISGAGRYGL